MNLKFNINLAQNYSKKSQITRVLSENWVLKNSYCPKCGTTPIQEFENNRPVADFYCKNCAEEFELKSKYQKIGNLIVDGAYSTMIERINSDNNPNFFFLSYTKQLIVSNFVIIPKHFFTPEIIIQRRPLSIKAKRAGWVGCNIDISQISEFGKVFIVKNSQIINPEIVKQAFNQTLFIRAKDTNAKGWLLDILKCIDSVKKENFILEDIYQFEGTLKEKHPNNRFIKDKIRQQLQILRDKGIIKFNGRGHYKKIKNESI